MRRFCRLLLLVLISVSAHAAGVVPTPDEETLNVPVTLAAKGMSLSDLAAVLSRQTGARVQATKEIADDKATVLVSKKPLREVLTGLELVSGGRWRWSVVRNEKGTAYELWEPSTSRSIRRQAEASLEGAMPEDVDSALDRIIETSKRDHAAIFARSSELIRLMKVRNLTTDEHEELVLLDSAIGVGPAAARMYRMLSPEVRELLTSGCKAYFDTNTSEPEWRIPPEIASGLAKAVAEATNNPRFETDLQHHAWNIKIAAASGKGVPTVYGEFSHYDPRADSSPQSSGGGPGFLLELPNSTPPTRAKPQLPMAPDDGTLSRQISFTTKELADEANLYDRVDTDPLVDAGRDDVLALLHRKLGVQVIADSRTGWSRFRPGEARTVADVLSHIGDKMVPKASPEWGWDGTYLFMREQYPYQSCVREIPNRVLTKAKTDVREQGCLSLDSVADTMYWTQRSEVFSTMHSQRLTREKGVDYRDKIGADLGGGGPVLTFYGLLTAVQRESILRGGLRVADLSPSQRDALPTCGKDEIEDREKRRAAERGVGVYNKNGLRIDKVQPGSESGWPDMVRLERRGSDRFFLYVGPILPSTAQPRAEMVTAPTPQAAWEKCVALYPTLAKSPHFFGTDANYVMVLTSPDGTTKEIAMPMVERVRVEGPPKGG